MATIKTTIQIRRDTTANWETNGSFVPAEGEPCLDLDLGTVKYGDGITSYADLPVSGGGGTTASHYEGVMADGETANDVIERVLGETTPAVDDIFVVKALIADGKYSYTAYVYDGSVWAAMDGNYSADNVYFADDMTLTYAFGKYEPEDGSVTIPASGLSLTELITAAYAEDQNPTITAPSLVVYSSQLKAYEVGTSVTPAYTATFSAGSYEYGPTPTGVEATAYSVTDGTNTLDTASGTFDAMTVGDSTSYGITATVTYSDGEVPLTALGAEYADGQITAGSVSATARQSATNSTTKITGYRNTFYGTTTDKSVETDSAVIRALASKSGKAMANGGSFTITIPVGALRVIFAYPATLQDVSSVQDVNGMSAEIKSSFTQTTVSVEGANGYDAIDYKVYTLDYASANDTANTYKVTI